MAEPIVDICKLYKRKKKNTILRKVTFSLEKGKVHAFVGENGSGKTTLAKVVSGLWTQDEGTIEPYPLYQPIFVFQGNFLDEHISGIANLKLLATARGRRPGEYVTGVQKKIKEMGGAQLANLLQLKMKKLSGGQRRFVELVSMLEMDSEPQYIILDEPTAGIDLRHKPILLNYIREKFITCRVGIICTHDQKEFELSDRYIKLVQGKVEEKGVSYTEKNGKRIGKKLEEIIV